MTSQPKITKLEVHEFKFEVQDVGPGEHGAVYTPGSKATRTAHALRVFTDVGVVGEYVGGGAVEYAALPSLVPLLVGKNPLERERINTELKRATRGRARIGMAPIDIALWDLAGKYHDAPIHQLLGGWRKTLPTYVATAHADDSGGLDRPEAYAEFAVQCKEMGYPGFKIHGWEDAIVEREIATVRQVRKSVGPGMDLMLDPFNALKNFADTLKVGRACDDEEYFWYEDPFADGGISQFAHRKLRQLIKTPLLMAEHVNSLEPRMDFILADATDFVRGDIGDGGITGSMKLAHAAESVGVDIEFHSPGPAQRQCIAAIRNTNYYELSGSHPNKANGNYVPVYKDDYRDDLDAADENGHFPVPQGPGLGVEYDWDLIARWRTGLATYD